MKTAGIIGGIITAVLGLCVILFPDLLRWIVGLVFIVTGLVYVFQWIKK